MKTRPELDSALDALAQQLPAMIAAHPDDADFWPALAGVADEIADNAGVLDCDHVHTRLDAMLGCRGGRQ